MGEEFITASRYYEKLAKSAARNAMKELSFLPKEVTEEVAIYKEFTGGFDEKWCAVYHGRKLAEYSMVFEGGAITLKNFNVLVSAEDIFDMKNK